MSVRAVAAPVGGVLAGGPRARRLLGDLEGRAWPSSATMARSVTSSVVAVACLRTTGWRGGSVGPSAVVMAAVTAHAVSEVRARTHALPAGARARHLSASADCSCPATPREPRRLGWDRDVRLVVLTGLPADASLDAAVTDHDRMASRLSLLPRP